MNKLNKIFYFNNDPFSYGEIDVSGNTLLTGTNGAGKSTSMRSVLFFYGVKNSSDLGLKKSNGEKKWRDYFYPDENSYTFYQYTGLYHEILVMTYRLKKVMQYRFIKLNIEDTLSLKDIVIESKNTLMPKELLSLFAQNGYEVSDAITSAEVYKSILYGQANSKTHGKFSQYALMKTRGDYNLIAKVLPEIFLSSSLSSGTIESAIANSYESESNISLTKMHSQIINTLKQYNTIVAFNNELSSRKKLEKELSSIMSQKEKLFKSVSQLIISYEHFKKILPNLQEEYDTETQKYNNLCSSGAEEISQMEKKRDHLLSIFNKADEQLESAQKLEKKYKDRDMASLVAKVDSLDDIKEIFSNLKKQLETITGEHNQINQKFLKQKSDIRNKVLEKKENRSHIEEEEREKNESRKSLIYKESEEKKAFVYKESKEKQKELLEATQEAQAKYQKASETKLLLSIDQFNQELLKAEQLLEQNMDSIKETTHLLALNKSSIEITIKDRELISQNIFSTNNESNHIYEEYKKQIDAQIQEQEKLLSPAKGSLLSFVREYGEDYDSIITSIAKDSVLLQSDLQPYRSDSNQRDFFGIVFDTKNLKPSSYSLEHIKNAITTLKNKKEQKKEHEEERIAPILKELTKKENLKSQKLAELNSTRNRLESKLLSLESASIELNDRCKILKEKTKNTFSEAQQEVINKLSQSERALELAKNLQNEHNNRVSNRISDIDKNSDAQIKAITDSAWSRKKKYEAFKLEMDTYLTESLEEIDKLENLALSKEGVDKEKLISLKDKIAHQEKLYKENSKHIEIVKSYKYEKERIDSIPQLKVKLEEASQEYNTSNNSLIAKKNKQKKIEDEKQNLLNSIKSKIDNAGFQINGVEKEIQDNKINEMEHDVNFCGLEISENLHVDVHDILNFRRNIENSLEEISKIIQRIESKLGEFYSDSNKAIFKFYKGFKEDEIIDAAQDMISFGSDGRFEDAKILVARQIKMVYSIVSQSYMELIKKSDNVSSLISKINSQLKASIENIEIIRNIEMRYEPIIDPVLSALEEITSIDLPIGTQGSLFNSDKDSKAYNQILKAFEKLTDSLSIDKRDEIGIVDTFQVLFRVNERGEDSGWVKSRETIGSKGTTIIVKSLTYIALLYTVLKLAKRDDDSMFHVLLDEIGTLAQGNMRKIVEFANDRNILFLNAAPDSKIPDKFKNIYYFKPIGRKSKIIQVAKKHEAKS